jgi:hypothetical protein
MQTSGGSTSNDRDEGGTAHQQMLAAIAAATATLVGPPFETETVAKSADDAIRRLRSLTRDDRSHFGPTERAAGEAILSALGEVQQRIQELLAQQKAANRRAKRMFAWGVLLGLPVGMLGSLLTWAIGIS